MKKILQYIYMLVRRAKSTRLARTLVAGDPDLGKPEDVSDSLEKVSALKPDVTPSPEFKRKLKKKLDNLVAVHDLNGMHYERKGPRVPRLLIRYAGITVSAVFIIGLLFMPGIFFHDSLMQGFVGQKSAPTGPLSYYKVQNETALYNVNTKAPNQIPKTEKQAVTTSPSSPPNMMSANDSKMSVSNQTGPQNTTTMTNTTTTGMVTGESDKNKDSSDVVSNLTALQQQQSQFNTEEYDKLVENQFLETVKNPMSTFSIDVDTASYTNIRRFVENGQLPPSDSVRIEEMINYFKYQYAQPTGNDPVAVTMELSDCPWNPENKLLLVGLQGRNADMTNLPPSNLVFLLDVSGSMQDANKLPLVKEAFKLLVANLRPQDRVAIVVYAGAAGLVLPSTSGKDKETILASIARLEAGGTTAGGEGIKLAYDIALKNYIKGGNKRGILATDGDFNTGESSDAAMVTLIEEKRKLGVFLTVLGVGMGNYKDSKMEKLADAGNGNYAYFDTLKEAQKVFVTDITGTLYVLAKDVKFQIEFNPGKVAKYRLIGYEDRILAREDFDNDQKDAGEIGYGLTVTALYEIIPETGTPQNDSTRYQTTVSNSSTQNSGELCFVKIRYKQPDGDVSKLTEIPIQWNPVPFSSASNNFRFAAAVAELGLILRNSAFKAKATIEQVLTIAADTLNYDPEGYRHDFIDLVKKIKALLKKQG